MPTKAKRAAIYTRISNDKEGRKLGVARQEKLCREHAAKAGLNVVGVFSDNDISASTSSRKARPKWDKMLDAAEAGAFDVIVAYSTSRLTRRPGEREDLIELHNEHGTKLTFVVSGEPDLTTAAGRQTFRLLGTIDTGEAETTAERVRAKHQELAEAGRHNGPRPFGWNIKGTGANQRLVINKKEAAVLRECVDRVLNGEGIWKITKDLNARGITTSTGRTWSTQVLRRVLLRDRNCGYRSHQPRKRGKPVGKPVRYEGQWEAIIDEGTHDRLVALLTDPSRRTNNRGTEVKYLLTSLAHCGACEGYVVGTKEFTYTVKGYKRVDGTRSPSKSRVYPPAYKCPTAGCMKVQRRMADVDAHVEAVVIGRLERDGVQLLGGDAVAVKAATARIAALEAKLDLAADRFADGDWTEEQVTRINAKVRPELDAEKARLNAALPAIGMDEFTGPGVREAWARADVERRKAILRALKLNITIHPIGSGNGGEYDPDAVSITWG